MKRIGDQEVVNVAGLESCWSVSTEDMCFELALDDHSSKFTGRVLPVTPNDEGSLEELKETKKVAEDLRIQIYIYISRHIYIYNLDHNIYVPFRFGAGNRSKPAPPSFSPAGALNSGLVGELVLFDRFFSGRGMCKTSAPRFGWRRVFFP